MQKNRETFQLPLDLGHRIAYGRDDFLVSPSNVEAVTWIDRWQEWTHPVLILYGPAASGKTHLAAVWAAQSKAFFWTVDDVISEKPLAGYKALVIEHADLLIGDRDAETKLFHLYNMAKEQNFFCLITTTAPPSQLSFALPDLASRLKSSPSVGIHAPDDTLLSAILVKLFADRQITVAPDVLRYILPRMDRSFVAARHLVEKADNLALAQKRPISIPLIRHVIEAYREGDGNSVESHSEL